MSEQAAEVTTFPIPEAVVEDLQRATSVIQQARGLIDLSRRSIGAPDGYEINWETKRFEAPKEG